MRVLLRSSGPVPEVWDDAVRGPSLDQVMSWRPAARTIGPMQCVALSVALLPGQAEAARGALASCQAGAGQEAYHDARRRAGPIREAVGIQAGTGGDGS